MADALGNPWCDLRTMCDRAAANKLRWPSLDVQLAVANEDEKRDVREYMASAHPVVAYEIAA